MGNGYNQHQQEQLYHHFRSNSSSFFLPMLCKVSMKDVKLHNNYKVDDHLEPSSPKVSCMGQVKIKNNKVIGFPTPYRPVCPTNNNIATSKVKYAKLKKLFSAKNISTSVTVAAGFRNNRSANLEISKNIEVNVSELDPPLPVVKKVKSPPPDGGLWKRRSGGVALTTLHIQRVDLPAHNNSLQPTTV